MYLLVYSGQRTTKIITHLSAYLMKILSIHLQTTFLIPLPFVKIDHVALYNGWSSKQEKWQLQI